MPNNKYLLDTNVIIYSLKAKLELPEAAYFVTEITKNEILSFSNIPESEKIKLGNMLEELEVIEISETTKSNALKIQQKYGLPLPDSIICAVSFTKKLTLITNDQLLHQVKEIEVESFYFVDS